MKIINLEEKKRHVFQILLVLFDWNILEGENDIFFKKM
jgi:hypothetical protein